jgi:hypothetical protein
MSNPHLKPTVLDRFVVNVDGVRQCLRIAATNRPIVHPLGDI